jgi:hypothetical protein
MAPPKYHSMNINSHRIIAKLWHNKKKENCLLYRHKNSTSPILYVHITITTKKQKSITNPRNHLQKDRGWVAIQLRPPMQLSHKVKCKTNL